MSYPHTIEKFQNLKINLVLQSLNNRLPMHLSLTLISSTFLIKII